jgi:hypothetical protein
VSFTPKIDRALLVVARDILAGLTREAIRVRIDDRETFDVATLVLDTDDGLHAMVSVAGELLRSQPTALRAALKYEIRHALVQLQDMRAA